MPRGWDPDYAEEMESVDPKPIILFEIATGLTGASDPEHVRVAIYDVDVVFPDNTGETFTARPGTGSEFTMKPGDLGPTEITFADADEYFSDLLEDTDFQWKKFKRYYIEADAATNVTMAQLDVWRVQNVTRGHHEVTFTVVPLLSVLNVAKVPQRIMLKSLFPGIPRAGTVR